MCVCILKNTQKISVYIYIMILYVYLSLSMALSAKDTYILYIMLYSPLVSNKVLESHMSHEKWD